MFFNKNLFVFAIGVVCLHAVNPAIANPEPTRSKVVKTFPEVLVKGDRYQAVEKRLENNPGGVALITAPEIENTRATNLKDVFQLTPGVYVQPRQGAADEATISIRGSGIRNQFHLRGISFFLDGMLLNNADGFGDFDTLELLALDRIEVFKGANGLEYGANALGGAVNFVSKTGHTAEPFKVRVEAGSFGFVKGQISSGQTISDNMDYYLSATAQHEDGWRHHQESDRQRLFSNFGWSPYRDVDLRYYLIAVNSRNALAGSITKSQLQLAPRDATAGSIPLNQRRDTEVLRQAVAFSNRIDQTQIIEGDLYYQWKDLDHPLAFAWVDVEYNDAGVQTRYINTTPLWGNQNEFIAGFTPQYGRMNDAQFANVAGSRGAMRRDLRAETTNLKAWVQDTYTFLPDWKAVAGTSFLHTRRKLNDRFLPDGDQTSDAYYTGFSPRLGLIYDLSQDIQIYGNLSSAFEPPIFGELILANNAALVNLSPQKSYQVEVGSRGVLKTIDWDLSVYHAEIEDELFQNTVGATGASTLSNIPRSHHTGVEVGMGVRLVEGLLESSAGEATDYIKLATNYSWSHFFIRKDGAFTGNRLPGMPEHYWVTQLSYHHPVGFYYSFQVETVPSDYFVDKANTLEADGYTTFGMRSGMEWKNGVKVFGEIRNLKDQVYASAVSTSERATPTTAAFKPADGVAIYGGVEWNY
jgi:iron complex outermembrane recepter protein